MYLLEVLVEHRVMTLNRPFTYLYDGDRKVSVGSRVSIIFNNQKLIGYVTNVDETNKTKKELEKEYGYVFSYVNEVLNEESFLNEELQELAEELASYYVAPLISVLQTMLPTSLKPSSSSLKGPKVYYEQYIKLINDDETDLTPRQVEILRIIKNNEDLRKKDIKSPWILDALIKHKRIKIIKKEVNRLKIEATIEDKEVELTDDQKEAVESILNTDKEVTLLEGVTGSGKTEVYLALAKKILEQGKTVIMLVPEISLTPMMVNQFSSRFKESIAIFHSNLTNAERYDEYRRITKGECKIVVGARSAIFSPLKDIGLIVLDEEHSESYKQDAMPFYHAKEVAIMRAKHYKAKVLLGSATPSLDSRARAQKGIYNYFLLNKRINEMPLPQTEIVNLTNSQNLSRKSTMFSQILLDALEETFANNEQAILLINHRGYSKYLTCRQCGHIFRCPSCGIGLTYHKSSNLLKCHHCGYVEHVSETCPKCGSQYIAKIGFGTERVVDEVKKLFPDKRTIRLDSDSSISSQKLNEVMIDFKDRKYDVLVGTQMIAKGLDFPNVTLVGVILADIGLALPSYKSAERTFQLLTQAVGRSGRSNKKGRAIIQTYNPSHYAIKYASEQDYFGFYTTEMKIRKIQQYPPFVYLIAIKLSSTNEKTLIEYVHQLAVLINNREFQDMTIVGPITPFIPFFEKRYHRLLVLKCKDVYKIKEYLSRMEQEKIITSTVDIKIDVDTFDF